MILKTSANNTEIYWEKKEQVLFVFKILFYNILTTSEKDIWTKWGFL